MSLLALYPSNVLPLVLIHGGHRPGVKKGTGSGPRVQKSTLGEGWVQHTPG